MHEPNSAPWALSMRVPMAITSSRRGEDVLASCAHLTSPPFGSRGRTVPARAIPFHFRRFLARSVTGALP